MAEPFSTWNGIFISLTSTDGSFNFTDTDFEDIIVKDNYAVINVRVNNTKKLTISGCVFKRCKCSGNGMGDDGAPIRIEIGANISGGKKSPESLGGELVIENSKLIDCSASTGKVQALYVKANATLSNFKFDSIELYYTNHTGEEIIFLDIPSLPTSSSDVSTFKTKFVDLCPYLNNRNFIMKHSTALLNIICIGDIILVSSNGSNSTSCGDINSPCLTIPYGLSRVISSRNYLEMSVILLFVKNKYTIDTTCVLSDITLMSWMNPNEDNIVEVAERPFSSGVFTISSGCVRFLSLVLFLIYLHPQIHLFLNHSFHTPQQNY
jgi:hypothetical protein